MKRKSQTSSNLPTKRRTYNCLKIDNDAWVSFHQSSLRSLENSNYDAAIDSATQALNLLDTLKAKVLDTYSAAYAKKGKFSKALEAAEKMIECTPLSAAGYLRAGETLALQGKHKRAIQVYTQGAEKASIEDEQYTSLEESKAASEAQLDKRVDFLAKLPVDLAHFVIRQLGHIDYRMTCMNVSKTWRWVVADCAPAWRRLSLIGHQLENAIFRYIPLVGKHIHILRLDHATADQTQQIIRPIFHDQLGNIHDLDISNWSLGRDLLFATVTRLGNSLTELKLRDNISDQALLLQSILFTCPRLQTLAYHTVGDMAFSEDNTVIPLVSNLKSLSLNAKSIPIPVLEATLRLCPHLQELDVESCAGYGLKAIIDHCSRLKILRFNGKSQKSNQLVEGLPGMQQLMIRNRLGPPVPQHVIQLLNQNRTSLQEVWLSLPEQGSDVYERWSGLEGIEGENLKTLTYARGSSMEMHAIIAAMIQKCRALETVTFYYLNQVASDVLYDAILKLPKLHTLNLFGIRDTNISSLELYFTAHAIKGKSSPLRKVTLAKGGNLSNTILERLATIETLQCIEIDEYKYYTNDGLVKFGNQLSAHKTLQSLRLRKMTQITDPVLRSLIDISSLRELSLSELPFITGHTLEAVVKKLKNLEEVIIEDCPQIDLELRERVKRKLDENNKAKRMK